MLCDLISNFFDSELKLNLVTREEGRQVKFENLRIIILESASFCKTKRNNRVRFLLEQNENAPRE